MELVAASDKEASKLFGLFLYHKGYVLWLAERSNPVAVTVKISTVCSTYNIGGTKKKSMQRQHVEREYKLDAYNKWQ